MKKVQIVISAVLAIALLAGLLLLGTGLLRVGWVDIPYDDIVSIRINSTLKDNFQFDITDPHHMESLLNDLDGLGLMLHTPKSSSNGSIYFLNLKSADGTYYAVSILDGNHFTANNRRYRADMSPILLFIDSLEENARSSEKEDLSELFYRALHEPASKMEVELAEAFDKAPDAFITQLAQEEYETQDTVRCLICEQYTCNGTALELAMFLMAKLPQIDHASAPQERDLISHFLITLSLDVTNAGDDFLHAVLDTLPYSDGALTETLGYHLSRLYGNDPAAVVRIAAQKETEDQKNIASILVYSTTYSERISEFIADTENLAGDNTLTEAEQAVVALIQNELAAYDKEALTPL